MGQPFWRGFGVCIAAAACFASFSLARGIADREAPITYTGAKARSSTVVQGGTLELEFSVIRHRNCRRDVRRLLTDSKGEIHSLPTYTVGPSTQIGSDEYDRRITIPPAAAVGPASYRLSLSYVCNALQEALGWPIEVEAPRILFEITPRPNWMLPAKDRGIRN